MRKEIAPDGLPLVYYHYGQGNLTLLLLPGFAETAEVFRYIIGPLSASYSILIPELPGAGDSADRKDIHDLTETARLLYTILEAEQINKCCVLGHSMGGYLALALAERYPDQFVALGLIHSSCYSDDDAKTEARNKGIHFIRSYGHGKFITETNIKLFHEEFRVKQPDEVNRYLQMGVAYFTPETLIRYYEMMRDRPDRSQVLKHGRPVLIIAGEADNAIPPELSIEQSKLPEKCYFHILENTGHVSMIECPEVLLEKIDSFVRPL